MNKQINIISKDEFKEIVRTECKELYNYELMLNQFWEFCRETYLDFLYGSVMSLRNGSIISDNYFKIERQLLEYFSLNSRFFEEIKGFEICSFFSTILFKLDKDFSENKYNNMIKMISKKFNQVLHELKWEWW